MSFLLQIVDTRTGFKLRALAGQKTPDGNSVDDEKNVQGDTAIRPILGAGGIAYTESLTDRGKFYQAGNIYVCDKELAKKHSLELAPEEGLKMYQEYLDSLGKGKISSKPKDIVTTSFLGKLMAKEKFFPPAFDETGFYVDRDIWYLLLRNVKKQVNTMIYGHSGTGKTELVLLLAEQLEMEIEVFDMGSALDPTATLVGVHRLEDGASVFDFSRFYHAIQKPCIILLDELSRAPENTTNLLLPCLDSRRTLYTDIGSSHVAREVPVHEDVIFIATANVGSEYVGVNLLDKALLSRFFKIELDYPSKETEIAILQTRTGVPRKDAEIITKICQDIRGGYVKGSLSKDVSLRESLETAELVGDGFPVLDALKLVILPCFEGAVDGGERSVILAKIMAL